MAKTIYIGRSNNPVEVLYMSPDNKFAVVKSFHTPPKFIVFSSGYGGWIKEAEFTGIKAAVKHAKKGSTTYSARK